MTIPVMWPLRMWQAWSRTEVGSELHDEVIGQVIEEVRSDGTDGLGEAWRLPGAHRDDVTKWVEASSGSVKHITGRGRIGHPAAAGHQRFAVCFRVGRKSGSSLWRVSGGLTACGLRIHQHAASPGNLADCQSLQDGRTFAEL